MGDDACVIADDEDRTRGLWCLSRALQGPFGGPLIRGGEGVRDPWYVV